MKIFVRTRGKSADYAFLGGAPSNRWWLDFRDATSFEQPTLIVGGDRKEWHCFLSGIPSSRVDRVGTAVRYSVVLEGSCNVKVETVLSLIAAWLEDATSDIPKNHVQLALDHAFDEATVERLLHIRGAQTESANEVQRLALEALCKLRFPKKFVGEVASESWVGSTTSLDAKSEFLARCSQLILGDFDGSAAVLNLLGTADEVVGFAGKFTSLAALIDDECAPLKRIITIEKKKPINLYPPVSQIPKSTVPWKRISLVLGAILLVIWVLTPKTPPPRGDGAAQLGR